MERTIEVTTTVASTYVRCRRALLADPIAVVAGAEPGLPSARCVVGDIVETLDGIWFDLWVQPAHLERLLPEIEARLDLRDHPEGTELHLRASYLAPIGSAARFGDGVVGHRLVRHALVGFLDDVAHRLTRAAAGTLAEHVVREPSTP